MTNKYISANLSVFLAGMSAIFACLALWFGNEAQVRNQSAWLDEGGHSKLLQDRIETLTHLVSKIETRFELKDAGPVGNESSGEFLSKLESLEESVRMLEARLVTASSFLATPVEEQSQDEKKVELQRRAAMGYRSAFLDDSRPAAIRFASLRMLLMPPFDGELDNVEIFEISNILRSLKLAGKGIESAIDSLADLKEERLLPVYLEILADAEDPDLRSELLQAIVQIKGHPQILEVVERLANEDPDTEVMELAQMFASALRKKSQ